jgi:tRNA (adenine22-N1)-methyltransferase
MQSIALTDAFKEEIMNFGARLSAIAALVPPCGTLIDVGTDHAYLPVLVTSEGKVRKAIAGDIVEGPCEAARKTVALYHKSDVIEVRQGSGLTVARPGEVNVIVIAGMGAGTMLQILEASPAVWNDAACTSMVLQPMSDSELLRHWSEEHGWGIVREDLVEENHKIYEILVLQKDDTYHYPGISYFVGDDVVRRHHPLLVPFTEHLLDQYNHVLTSMQHSRAATESRHYLEYETIKKQLEEILNGNKSQ